MMSARDRRRRVVGVFIIAGSIALTMAFAAGRVRRMPISESVIYLAVGIILGPGVSGLIDLDASAHFGMIQALMQIIITISVFGIGLKLRSLRSTATGSSRCVSHS